MKGLVVFRIAITPGPGLGYPLRDISETLEEERRELLDSVLEELRSQWLDPDCRAACQCLLAHLARG